MKIPRKDTEEVQKILKSTDTPFEKARAIYYFNYSELCRENPFDKITPDYCINDILEAIDGVV